jgi:hypothetical protein
VTPDIQPDFFIAGGAKCGTTALYEYLRAHPGVLMPIRKDLHYFATDLPGKQRIHAWSQYQQTFRGRPQGKRVGEASALYLYSHDALKNIRALNPRAKIIALLRNPIEVAIAYQAQQVFNLAEDVTDFGQAWRLREERRRGTHIPRGCPEPRVLQYQEVASLGTQVERLLDLFPASQVKLFLFDEFVADTRQVYTETLDFLDLPPDGREDFPPVNERKTVRLAWLKRFEQSLRVPLPVSRAVERLGLRQLKERLYRGGAPRYTPDSTLTEELVRAFEPEINTLSRLLQRDLTPWMTMQPITTRPPANAAGSARPAV